MFNPLTLGSLTGFITFTFSSHPRLPIARSCPQIKLFKKIQFLPQFKIFYKKEKAFVCHHWLWLLALLVFSFLFLHEYQFIKGFLAGGVGQGLIYRDRFEFREKN